MQKWPVAGGQWPVKKMAMTFGVSHFWPLATGNWPLAVGFVTPWFFGAGFLLASVPVIIHILNRRRFKTVN